MATQLHTTVFKYIFRYVLSIMWLVLSNIFFEQLFYEDICLIIGLYQYIKGTFF